MTVASEPDLQARRLNNPPFHAWTLGVHTDDVATHHDTYVAIDPNVELTSLDSAMRTASAILKVRSLILGHPGRVHVHQIILEQGIQGGVVGGADCLTALRFRLQEVDHQLVRPLAPVPA